MNYKNFNLMQKIFIALFFLTSLYGFISFDQIPIVQIFKSLDRFSFENLITGKTLFFIQTFVLALFIMEPLKVGLFIVVSFILNIIIFKSLGISIDQNMILNALNFASISGISAFIVEFRKNKDKRDYYKYGLFMGGVPILFAYFIVTSLNVMTNILPNTNDIQAIFIDNFFHIPRSTNQYFYFFNDYITNNGLVYNIILNGYNAITIGIVILSIWEYSKENKRYYTNTIVNALILLCLGIILYTFFPIMGPKYLQLNLNSIINGTVKWSDYLGVVLTGSTFPRNGMPSMHFGITLFAFLNSKGLNLFKRSVLFSFFIITALATIILGEHYFIDWIGALPVIVISMIISDTYVSWKEKKWLLISNITNLLIWYIFLWYSIKYLSIIFDCVDCHSFNYSMTTILYLLSITTIINFVYSYKKLYRLGQESLNKEIQPNIDIFNFIKTEALNYLKNTKNITTKTQLSVLFVCSGFAGLMYQVIFGKILSTTFGSTSLAIYIILATYMIGLSIGSWLGGKGNSEVSAIIKYAFCEGLIALYCAFTPTIFNLLDGIYISLLHIHPDSVLYATSIKILLGISGLLIPTILMGMTTPILLKEFNKNESSGISVAKLYTLNTLGASFGAILSGYILIQSLGIKNSIFFTVLLNLIICAYAINIFKKNNSDEDLKNASKNVLIDFFNIFKFKFSKTYFIKTENYYYGILLLFFSGLFTMIMETVYVHSLSIVVGNSTYVFSIMLFTFLLGLSLGGYFGKIIMQTTLINKKLLSVFELFLGLSIFISFNLIDKIPNYFGSFVNSQTIKTFESQEFLKFVMCFGIMIIPTIITGIIYTLSMNLLTLDYEEKVNQNVVGQGLAINTIGNILGIFIGGFVFVNLLQIQGSFKALTTLVIIISIVLSYKDKKFLFINSVILCFMLYNSFSLNMKEITSGSNVYFNTSSRGDVIEFKESIDGGLTSVNVMKGNNENKILTLLTNGKFQGNDNAESIAQGAFAIAPIMHMENIKDSKALVIGYGTGMTTRAIYDSGFKEIDLVDLSEDILVLADKYFNVINENVRSKKNVYTHITDGRNYLKLTDKKYDLISMEITSIWFAGASYLYNQEFYKIAKQKLNDDGVLQQWVQMHHMNPNDFNIILNTIRSEFQYVNVYYIGGQGIIVATNSEKHKDLNQNTLKDLNNNKALNEIRKYYEDDFKVIEDKKILNSESTDKMLLKIYGKNTNFFVSNDNNLQLEYSTPKGNALKFDTEKAIIKMIKKYNN